MRVDASSIEVLEFTSHTCRVHLTCSAGYYVRALVRDLGERVGTGACLSALRRTRSGDFRIGGAISLEALTQQPSLWEDRMIPLGRLLGGLPAVTATAAARVRVSQGRSLGPADLLGSVAPAGHAWVRILDEKGALLAIGTPEPAPGVLHPKVVLT